MFTLLENGIRIGQDNGNGVGQEQDDVPDPARKSSPSEATGPVKTSTKQSTCHQALNTGMPGVWEP